MFFKVAAKKTLQPPYTVQATCKNGHTSFKKAGDNSSEYVCPYCGWHLP